MSFAEFQIRLFAYERMQLKEWEKTRFIAWSAFIGSHQDPKKSPKTIDKFLPLGNKPKASVTEEQRQRFLEVTEQYLKEKNYGRT
jgi:hypothetical protein